jgi:hypothetical protein
MGQGVKHENHQIKLGDLHHQAPAFRFGFEPCQRNDWHGPLNWMARAILQSWWKK